MVRGSARLSPPVCARLFFPFFTSYLPYLTASTTQNSALKVINLETLAFGFEWSLFSYKGPDQLHSKLG